MRLGHRQAEAVGHEGLALDVELAHLGRVAAARGQQDQRAAVVRVAELGAAEGVRHALLLREGVDVHHGVPVRVGLAELGQRRAAVQAARVRRVLPQVVEPAAVALDLGQARRAAQRRHRVAVQARVLGQCRQSLRRALVVLRDPGHRARAVDVLQPLVRVVDGLRQDGRGAQEERGRGEQGVAAPGLAGEEFHEGGGIRGGTS